MAELEQVIRSCGFFRAVAPERLERIIGCARWREFERDEQILRPGDAPPGLFIVAEGAVRIYNLAASGKEHVLHLAGAGQTFAEVAVIGGFPAPAFAEATEPTRAVMIGADEFRAAMREDHQFCMELMLGMAKWVRHFIGLMEDIVLRDAAGRLAKYLVAAADEQDSAVVRLPSLKRHLASHLNLTSETLSRTLRRLAEAEIIAIDGRSAIEILNADQLADVADGLFPEL